MVQLLNPHPSVIPDAMGFKASYRVTEYRLYGWAPYNIKPIQAGIQFGHAAVDLVRSAQGSDQADNEIIEWADRHKTFIILNGGPTRATLDYGMSAIHSTLRTMERIFAHAPRVQAFREPDLNDALSGIVMVLRDSAFDRTILTKDAKDLCWGVFSHKVWGGLAPTEEAMSAWSSVSSVIGEWDLSMQCWLPKFDLWS